MRNLNLHTYRGYHIWPTDYVDSRGRWYIPGRVGGDRMYSEQCRLQFGTLAQAKAEVDYLISLDEMRKAGAAL